MRYAARKEVMSTLGVQEFQRIAPVPLNNVRDTTDVNHCGWYEFALYFEGSSNPYSFKPTYDKHYCRGASLRYEIVNNNVFPMKVVIRELAVKYNTSTGVLEMMQLPNPQGLGALWNDRDANPMDSAHFTRFFAVVETRELIVPAGRSVVYEYKPREFGKYGQVVGRYMWNAGGSMVWPYYTAGVHEPVLAQFIPMLQTGWSSTGALTSEIMSGAMVYLALERKVSYKYSVLQSKDPTRDFVRAFPGTNEPLFSRAPGSLEARTNNSIDPPLAALVAAAEAIDLGTTQQGADVMQ